MGVGFPSTIKVELEWVLNSGTWTDITSDVDMSAGIAVHFGRTSPFSQPSPATLTLQLANSTGKYTPGTQLLADGVTPHPNYPNVVPRRRIRVSYFAIATKYVYLGFVRGWPPMVENGVRPYVTVTAVCRLFQLAQTKLRGWLREECALQTQSLIAYYPMSDAAPSSGLGSAFFTDISGNNQPPLGQPYIGQTGFQAVTAGAANPMTQSEGLTGAGFQVQSGAATNSGSLQAFLPLSQSGMCLAQSVTFPAFVTGASASLNINLSTRDSSARYITIEFDQSSSGVQISAGEGTVSSIALTSIGSMTAGIPHFVQANLYSAGGGNYTLNVYVDGVALSSFTVTHTFTLSQLEYRFYQTATPAFNGPIVIGPAAVFTGTVTSGSPSPSNLYGASTGWDQQTSGTRIQKLLTYAGLTSGDWSVDQGGVVLSGAQTIAGRDVVSCCQDVATTEGAGSVIYTQPDGKIRYTDRNARTQNLPHTANMFFDAVGDLDGTAYQPAFDDTTLVNECTVTRAGGSTLTYTDTASVALFGTAGETITSYASTDADALALAQYHVAAQAPQFRLGQLTVNYVTATSQSSSSFYTQASDGGLIGAWVQINSLVPGRNSPTVMSMVFVEGWTLTITDKAWRWVADTSPAPAYWAGYFDNTDQGRFAPDDATWTLTSNITSSATSISLTTTAAHPTLSATVGDFPLYIQIGTEIMQVSSAPGGSTSPQTLTVVRAQESTQAAAQTAGSSISLWPGSRWGL